MYAIVEMGGKQYRVQEGDQVEVEKIPGEKASKIKIDRVLMLGGTSEAPIVGKPLVPGAFVEAEIVDDVKGPKLTIYKMKRRKNYRRKIGHRQGYTLLKVVGIKKA
jgi:large subunit ribosomal protein L21